MYFNLIGTIITIVIGLIISQITQSDVPITFGEKCVLPLSSLILGFLRDRICTKKNKTQDSEENGECHAMIQTDRLNLCRASVNGNKNA